MLRRTVVVWGILFIFFMSSCKFTLMKSDSVAIVVKGDSFTIEWDDDSLNISNNINKAESYRLYYKTHGSSYWSFLDNIDSELKPSYTISKSKLDFGIYDLGVSSINTSGKESDIHSSLDMTADPFCGWYVNWIGSN